MDSTIPLKALKEPAHGVRFSTAAVAPRDRCEWLNEVICREYANVAVTPPPDGELFNEMTLYPWEDLQLSAIRSSGLSIERLPREPHLNGQDAYFAVILLAGDYRLEQNGREVFLQPGDMTIYDATRLHRIYCPRDFGKLIVSIPRAALRSRIAGVEHCTAVRIPGNSGIGAVASNFMRATATQIGALSAQEFHALSDYSLDLLTLAINSVRPGNCNLSRIRSASLGSVKAYVERNLHDPALNAEGIAQGVGLSSRYINDLFKDEDISLMRYVWQCRLEGCRKDMLASAQAGQRISDIAYRRGFNDLAHFSRVFKQRFGCSPREYRQRGERVL